MVSAGTPRQARRPEGQQNHGHFDRLSDRSDHIDQPQRPVVEPVETPGASAAPMTGGLVADSAGRDGATRRGRARGGGLSL